MGGLLHLFYFHQGHSGRKHKKRGDGMKTPPHSRLELAAETSHTHDAVAHSQQDSAKTSSSFQMDASMKKLMNQEISKGSINRQTAPSVVAKLMGMDVLPADAKPGALSHAGKVDDMCIAASHKVKESTPPSSKKSKSSIKKGNPSYRDSYLRYWSSGTNSGRAEVRVHPQEKELQKFKKEFEAWQAARFLECARVVELGNIPDQWLAQLNLTKEKMALYESSRNTVADTSMDTKSRLSKSRSLREHSNELYSLSSSSSRCSSKDIDHLSFKNSDKSSASTKIVILKPGPDSFTTNDESWVSSSSSVEDRDCIEHLLEEVKERLKFEMQSKTLKKGSMGQGGGIQTPFKEKPGYRDLGRKLLRSESARLYRSDNYVDELTPCSPVFFSRDTRNFLSERLRNVLTREDQHDISNISDDFSRVPFVDDARERLEKARDILNAEAGRNHRQYMNYKDDMQARSFRHERRDEKCVEEESSPRNLVRSLSAPVSGTSFGKLLLEDRYVSAGAHIKRKHEALDHLTMDAKGHTREGFNFREKVSNIKYSLSLRKKLFTKKLQSVDLSHSNEFDSSKDMLNGPTVLSSFNYRNENLTEVPPSPASICNSPREDFWKPMDNPSPLSTSDVTPVGDQCVGNVFREISSNLTELRKQLNQLEYEGSEITTVTEYPSETEVAEAEDESEAYIKTLLVTSGLYDGSWEKSFSRWDPYVKPMSNWVFDKVEESYHQKPTNETDEVSKSSDDMKLYHKILFDLLNEALIIVLGAPRRLSKFRRTITETTVYPRPQGKKLVKKVWETIREYVYPTVDMVAYSLDDLAAHDLDVMAWSDMINEDVSGLGKELECLITNELVEEILMDMKKP